jgi:hypothetical protein
MSIFTTRVELHDATYSDYEELHEAMRKQGFKRTITSANGVEYHLPEAEYNSTSANRSDVLASAKIAATTTGKSFGILVTGDNGMTWDGLSKV